MPEPNEKGASNREKRAKPATEPEEEVLWEGKPALIAGIDGRMIKYRLTRRRLEIIHSGLTRKKAEHIPLADVESVSVVQGLTEQTAGVGDVIVSVRDGSRIVLEDLYHFYRVRDLIQEAAGKQEMQPAGPGSSA